MSDAPLFTRIKRSFEASAGEIVFGMEDGAVSIFGLVFGVAATTDQNSVVLIAGDPVCAPGHGAGAGRFGGPDHRADAGVTMHSTTGWAWPFQLAAGRQGQPDLRKITLLYGRR